MMKRSTIIDVTRHAAVLKSAVSFLKKECRSEIETPIKALGYVYNRASAKMRDLGTGLIGLVMNNLRNSFFTEFATSAQMTFSQYGFDDIKEGHEMNSELNSVRCDVERFGQAIAEIVVKRLEAGVKSLPVQRQPVELITCQSSMGRTS